jgi:polyphenol oxidase
MLPPALTNASRDGLSLLRDEGALSAGLLVAFTDRRGGISEPPFESLNLAMRVGDEEARVAENRVRVAAAAGFDPERLALARQVHGTRVIEIERGMTGVCGEADVLVARGPGPVLGVLTADCAPVALAGERGVALAHAGWRGLVAGVVERAVEQVAPVRSAWIGPCIHACCYEVGAEVVEAFAAGSLPVAGERRVDPGRAAAVALRRAGVEAIAARDECTSCNPRYFSYRRDGLTGRQGAFVSILAIAAGDD